MDIASVGSQKSGKAGKGGGAGRTHALFLGVTLLAVTACVKEKFQGSNQGDAATPNPIGRSPNEGDAGRQTAPNRPVPPNACVDSYMAARLAFVIDNTGSNGPGDKPGSGVSGTDPRRSGTSIRGKAEEFTSRQAAIYDAVAKTQEFDAKAFRSNPAFLGSALGIAYFPRGGGVDEILEPAYLSGPGGQAVTLFPAPMTQVKDLMTGEAFLDGVWRALDFTKNPAGPTQYVAALKAGSRLLKEGRVADDKRPDLLFLITDGLPNDRQPSAVKAARAALADTRVIILSIYTPGANEEEQNRVAKGALKDVFMRDDLAWGRAPGPNDGYGKSDSEFERYWTDLRKLPREISDRFVEVSNPANLAQELARILEVERKCP